jgi:hypothetical protein
MHMKFTGIVGVIVITLLVIIIASLTYVRVESLRQEQIKMDTIFIEGMVSNITQSGTISYHGSDMIVWNITISKINDVWENQSYNMIFDETYPPHSGLNLRFYYSEFTQNDQTYINVTSVAKVDL